MVDLPDLSSSYPLWAKVFLSLLIAVFIVVAVLSRQKPIPGQIVIDDIIHGSFPPVIDIRLRNTGTVTSGVSKVLFKVLRVEKAGSMVAKQEPSDEGTLILSPDVAAGDVLEVPVAVKVAGMDTDRILIKFRWHQRQPDIGYYYLVIPALKTSSGYVHGKSLMLHIQQNDESFADHGPDSLNKRPPPMWGDQEGAQLVFDWTEEERRSRKTVSH